MDRTVRVKVCGLTRKTDIDFVNELKPDYVGFVFAPSKRQVKPKQARQMILDLEPSIKKVGIFVDAPKEFVKDVSEECSLDILQFHGNETNEYWQGLAKPVWKALRIRSKEDLALVNSFKNIDAILLDSPTAGSGKTFDWSVGSGLKSFHPLVLAGGLNAENVTEAIAIFKPFAVDVSSGVETDGLKDYIKIKQFIENVRRFCEYDD